MPAAPMFPWLFLRLALLALAVAATVPLLLPTNSAVQASALAPQVIVAARADTSPPLRAAAILGQAGVERAGRSDDSRVIPLGRRNAGIRAAASQTVSQARLGSSVAQDRQPVARMPAPLASFDGLKATDITTGPVVPPDSNIDVGPNHVVEMTNLSFAVYDKTGGTLFGPVDLRVIWSGFGGLCEGNNGDPIVVYDRLADRWLVTQFTAPALGPYFLCLAVSQSADPAGAYHRYAFNVSPNDFPDYPKYGVWPDAYYMSTNDFRDPSSFFEGASVGAFDRAKMLVGDPTAALIRFKLANDRFSLLPSHFMGARLPPPGAPNVFAELQSLRQGSALDGLRLSRFTANFANPGLSTFTDVALLPAAPFEDLICGFSVFIQDCIPQRDSSALLDAIPDRLMFRLNYRNFGTHESLVVNHTVNAGTLVTPRAGVRWYELRQAAGVLSIFQQGTYAPDAEHRWMGSVSQDGLGNVAAGYSVSSATTFPSIRYAGRLASDPPGTFGQGEATLHSGIGSQLGSRNRWGDYTSLTVDPVDECTFWYVNQYYAVTSSFNWRTRIGSFRFPQCTAPPPAADLSITKVGPPSVTPGGALSYSITVLNAGPQPAENVTVSDVTPPGLSFGANSGDCLTAFPCLLGTLAPGQSRTINATFHLPNGYVGTNPVTNEAVASSSTADPNPANNTARAQTQVIVVTLTPTATPSPTATPPSIPGGGSLSGESALLTSVAGPSPVPTPAAEHGARDPDIRKETPAQRFQRKRTNAGSEEDERIEGNILAVSTLTDPPALTIGTRDGRVLVELIGEARALARRAQPGLYFSGTGQKEHELYFIADHGELE